MYALYNKDIKSYNKKASGKDNWTFKNYMSKQMDSVYHKRPETDDPTDIRSIEEPQKLENGMYKWDFILKLCFIAKYEAKK